METWDAIRSRRKVASYAERPIDDAHLEVALVERAVAESAERGDWVPVTT